MTDKADISKTMRKNISEEKVLFAENAMAKSKYFEFRMLFIYVGTGSILVSAIWFALCWFENNFVIGLIALPFVILGIRAFYEAFRRVYMEYAVTDKRLLSVIGEKLNYDVELDSITNLKYSEANGVLPANLHFSGKSDGKEITCSIFGISRLDELYSLLNEIAGKNGKEIKEQAEDGDI